MNVQNAIEINRALIHLANIDGLLCSYEVALNLNALKDIAAKFDSDQKKLVDKFVDKNADGSYKTKGENNELNDFGSKHEEFEKAATKMVEAEVEVELITFKKEDLKDGTGLAVNPPALVLLPLLNTVIIK